MLDRSILGHLHSNAGVTSGVGQQAADNTNNARLIASAVTSATSLAAAQASIGRMIEKVRNHMCRPYDCDGVDWLYDIIQIMEMRRSVMDIFETWAALEQVCIHTYTRAQCIDKISMSPVG